MAGSSAYLMEKSKESLIKETDPTNESKDFEYVVNKLFSDMIEQREWLISDMFEQRERYITDLKERWTQTC